MSEFLSSSTFQVTIIPTLVVIVALFFWFRRSQPRGMSRPPATGARPVTTDDYDVSVPRILREDEAPGDSEKVLRDMGDIIASERGTRTGPVADGASSGSVREDDSDILFDHLSEPAMTLPPYHEMRHTDEHREASVASRVAGDEQTAVAPRSTEVKQSTEGGKGGEPQRELILALSIIANAGQMRGPAIFAAAKSVGFSFDERGIFGFYRHGHDQEPLMSLANMLEPGSFRTEDLRSFTTPGVVLFSRIEEPSESLAVFQKMLDTAKQLAGMLNATVCNERREVLNKQTIDVIRTRIENYQRHGHYVQAHA